MFFVVVVSFCLRCWFCFWPVAADDCAQTFFFLIYAKTIKRHPANSRRSTVTQASMSGWKKKRGGEGGGASSTGNGTTGVFRSFSFCVCVRDTSSICEETKQTERRENIYLYFCTVEETRGVETLLVLCLHAKQDVAVT